MDHAAADLRHLWHPFTQQQEWVAEAPLVIAAGEGNWLVDVDGNRYLDGVASLWCNVHGHRHPRLDAAVSAQLGRIAHSTLLGLTNTAIVEATEKLMRVVPAGLTRAFYSENGAAAVEVALKMAYQYWQHQGATGKSRFLALDGAYHGDTLGAVSVGGIDEFHAAFAPLLFDCLRAPTNSPRRHLDELLGPMEAILRARGDEICAVIVEPLCQGANGIVTFPAGYLAAVRELCDRHDVLLVCDEVATGFGRTGAMFACDHEAVTPDLMTLGKGITGGYLPMSVTLAGEHVYEAFLAPAAAGRQLFHGHTYSGNPLAAAACVANLEIFETEGTLAALGPKLARMQDRLDRLARMPQVAEVRRCGAMVGIELDTAVCTSPSPGAEVCRRTRDSGVVLRPLGQVVVWMPPLSITDDEIDLLADATEEAVGGLP